ncbi:hypothetical protein FUAX_17510 [Fulvitalea axinellae]|uniref:Uncharacterized protein n=1 Tax=Fulvitalea axinellae TaxID=1182444 RepID=A0AAU9D4C3_9BACT|nr:hypothetical protein FUAX_17510 [Fulvitalea axinellae]
MKRIISLFTLLLFFGLGTSQASPEESCPYLEYLWSFYDNPTSAGMAGKDGGYFGIELGAVKGDVYQPAMASAPSWVQFDGLEHYTDSPSVDLGVISEYELGFTIQPNDTDQVREGIIVISINDCLIEIPVKQEAGDPEVCECPCGH